MSHGLPAPPGTYRWTVKADDGFHDPVERTHPFTVGLPDATALLR
jgi:hypothetical protein